MKLLDTRLYNVNYVITSAMPPSQQADKEGQYILGTIIITTINSTFNPTIAVNP